MKIAFLNKYQNRVARGAETYVSELSSRLSKDNQVDVISKVNYFDLLKNKYDVVIPTNGRLQVFLVRIVTWLTHSKMIVSGQSGIGWDDKLNLLAFPNAFVALSEKASNWAKKFNPSIKVVQIPNGVDLNKFTNNNLYFTNKIKTVLAVGAFTEQKRLDLTIKAVAKLDGVKLIIAGGGGELKDKINNLGINILGKERFELISVPFNQMPDIYKRANVFTLPSASSESFGNVLVEAMASGLPVVATDDEVRREIVGDAGLFVDPTNIDEYAKMIKKALETNWGTKPRSQAEKFSWDEIAKKYNELFSKLTK